VSTEGAAHYLPDGNLSHVQARLNYQADDVESSLRRNGKVLIKRDLSGSDASPVGIKIVPTTCQINNARLMPQPATLKRNGFQFENAPLSTEHQVDFYSEQSVLSHYYCQCEDLVKSVSGAAHVYAFDHNVRSASGKAAGKSIVGGSAVQGPAHAVHGDYTLTSAPQRVLDLGLPPKQNDTLGKVLQDGRSLIPPHVAKHVTGLGGRFSLINVWRNIRPEPVEHFPLALCDGQTVQPEDLVVFEIHYADRIGENYFANYKPQHQWFYYPRLTRDEALLILQWNSSGEIATSQGAKSDSGNPNGHCTFSFHTAFGDPSTVADAPDRESIEVRCLVIYDDEQTTVSSNL